MNIKHIRQGRDVLGAVVYHVFHPVTGERLGFAMPRSAAIRLLIRLHGE